MCVFRFSRVMFSRRCSIILYSAAHGLFNGRRSVAIYVMAIQFDDELHVQKYIIHSVAISVIILAISSLSLDGLVTIL